MSPPPKSPPHRSALLARTLLPSLSLALSGGLLVTAAAAQDMPLRDVAASMDWVPLERLSPELREAVPEACCGLYLPPVLPPLEGEPGEILLNAGENMESNANGTQLFLRGGVEIRQDDFLLRGGSGSYDTETEQATVEGGILVRRPGLLLTGAAATVDRRAGTSRVEEASYVLHEERARGSAEVIVYTDADGIVTIDNGYFSRCEPGDDSWLIRGDDIRLNRESGQGTARNVTLRVRDVPVFYLPYIRFPISDARASGFLAPVTGTTRYGGLDFALPYYFNLAPNYDATLTPRILTERGLMLGLEARHLGRRMLNEVDLAWLPDDDRFDPAVAMQPDSGSPPSKNRWLLDFEHIGSPGDRWTSYIDYTAVSDEDYFQDLGSSGLEITTLSFLPRTAFLSYATPEWRLTGSALGYQVIDPSVAEVNKPFDRLPRFTLDGDFRAGLGLEYGLNSEFVYFYRDLDAERLTAQDIAAGAQVTGSRLTVEPEVSLPLRSAGAFLVPRARYRYATYQLEDQAVGTPHDPDRGIAVASLDTGLVFERDLDWGGRPLVQTLEPRLFYLYSEYEDQSDIPVFDSGAMTFSFNQLFREDRFSGQDRVGDANQLTAALGTRFLDGQGRERASAQVGQIRYFEDRRVTLGNLPGEAERRNNSSIAGEFSYRFSDNWRANSYLEWNTSDNSLDVANFQFRYQSDINHIFNFSYRYRDVPQRIGPGGFDRRIDQTDISGIWPLNDAWSIIGRWNYDHANNRNLETIAGLEYSTCCWDMRVIGRRWIDNDALFFGSVEDNTGVFVQFELRGFGSVLGGSVSGILNNGITGYREREL